MSEQFWAFLGVAVTAAGGIIGAWRARDGSRLQAATERADFWSAELARSRERELAGLERERGLRNELTEIRQELGVLHHEFGEARKGRMAKERPSAAMVVLDGNGIIVDASENIPLLVGWRPDEIIGHPITKLMPTRFRAEHVQRLADASRTEKRVIRGEDDARAWLEMLHKDGHEVPVTIAIIGGGKGKAARYTGMVRLRSTD